MNATAGLLVDTVCRTVELGVTITDAAVEDDLTHLFCAPVAMYPTCPECRVAGRVRDHVERCVTDLPIAGHPTELHVRTPRFTCADTSCEVRILPQRMPMLATPGAKTTVRCTRWILQRRAIDRSHVSAVAGSLRLGWDLVDNLALNAVRGLVYDDTAHLDGVRVLGVDEHKWKHVGGDGSNAFAHRARRPHTRGRWHRPRLPDMVEGRSAKVLTDWLGDRDQQFRDRIKIVTMDGVTGYHSAAAVPAARTVLDPFHVVHLAAEKLTPCRQRVQQDTCGHRGRSGDPPYGIRRTIPTREELLTNKQKTRVHSASTTRDDHAVVEVTYRVHQRLIAAYSASRTRAGKIAMYKLLRSIRTAVPDEPAELAQLGRSLWKRRREILAHLDTGASNGPVEAINGRLEHLRGTALGFKNLRHHILRSPAHPGGLQTKINTL